LLRSLRFAFISRGRDASVEIQLDSALWRGVRGKLLGGLAIDCAETLEKAVVVVIAEAVAGEVAAEAIIVVKAVVASKAIAEAIAIKAVAVKVVAEAIVVVDDKSVAVEASRAGLRGHADDVSECVRASDAQDAGLVLQDPHPSPEAEEVVLINEVGISLLAD